MAESASFWNPWNYPCPHCGAPLESSGLAKAFALAVIPLGAALGMALLYARRWGQGPALVLLGLALVALLGAAVLIWRFTRFTVRGTRTER